MADLTLEAPSQVNERLQVQSKPRLDAAGHNELYKSAPASDQASTDPVPLRFEFTGTGSEYFRIWVVNVLLTIATLGMYSAWAKVRRLQYFYRNTRVAGAIFDYRGDPKAILKGRLLALVLVGGYKIAFDIYMPVAIGIGVLLICIMPWLLARAFRFKMLNSSYRGVRFHFRGTVGQAYRMLILFPILFALTGFFIWSLATSFSSRVSVGLVLTMAVLPLALISVSIPLAHYLLKRYQHDNAYFGHMPFFFEARIRDFFKLYGKATGCIILGAVAVGIFAAATHKLYAQTQEGSFAWLFEILYGLLTAYVMYLFYLVYMEARIQNLVWNNTTIAGLQFESKVKVSKLLAIHASNLALITLTLGLYKPFAAVRRMKYRIESMALIPIDGDLESFLADYSQDHAGALGQEAGDLFDIDIAL